MLVDDSSVIRGLMSRWLGADPAIEIVSSAANGQVALNALERTDPEIIVLDIEMPVMDGLTALPKILSIKPDVQVVMSSTLTVQNAKVSLQAMSLGAADYVPKPTTNRDVIASQSFQVEIIEKIKSLAEAKRKQLGRPLFKVDREDKQNVEQKVIRPQVVKISKTIKPSSVKPKIIGVGSSTGGPQALMEFVKGLKDKLTLPVVVTQHMPPSFTKILAGHLSRSTGLTCEEAEDGMELVGGRVYIAPGNYHLAVTEKSGKYYIKLNQDLPENFCRPAVDPMFRSLSNVFGPAVLGVILTGMGHDGLAGSRMIVEGGGTLLAQDEATSVVWGMPGAVSEAGLCNAVLPLSELAGKVNNLVLGGR
ncbi:MAG: chemotaxis response regulator protein-glutamate methylesterase [Kordiimonadaceae bacterium]|nr:chemotaxis response regulator protein-glutamate methylesterase [Kordiimonadaceae bacterium]